VPGRKSRVTTVVDDEVAKGLRALAVEHGAALSRIVEEALREYMAQRPHGSGADLLAQLPHRTGRPSRHDRLLEARRRASMRKRTGRPFKPSEQRDAQA
jgi:hypothetical protein